VTAPTETAPTDTGPVEPSAEGLDAPDPGILPVGYLGIVAPLDALGFALNTYLGVVYDEVIALVPAQALVFSFQQRRAATQARAMPYDVAAARRGVLVVRLDDIEEAELVRPVTGFRLRMTMRDGREQRWILQHGHLQETRAVLRSLLGRRFL
jgi:hypothetical protein